MSPQHFTSAEQQAIELYCGGDEALFISFRAACCEQFPSDLNQGDRAFAAGDWGNLRRVAHSMKGVLKSIGQAELAAQAAEVERTAEAGLVQLASQGWVQLSQGLAAAYGATVDEFCKPGSFMHTPLVLVVDDHPSTQQMMAVVLGQEFQVLSATDGHQALRLMSLQQPNAILLDWLMPGELSGLDVLQRLKASNQWQHIPVAMVTSLDDGPHILEGFRNGADEFFVKPCNPLRLVQWVRKVVGHQHESP